MTQGGQTLRMCDEGQLCSILGVSNNDCKTSSTCNFFNAIKTNPLQSLINPANRDSTDCTVCCCNKDGCNFAIGTKAFATLILACLSLVYFIKH
uniref:Activin types I and II receptor domain-containing protein n=1 Tax=Acrobeloides nanus TaxID=290746 RepID=A0A914EM56_9BILA